MGKYFTIQEFTKSNAAKKAGIKNIPNEKQINNINKLIDNILDPLREAYGKPIIVTSGFRCDELNDLVNGVRGSQHRTGQAADIRSREDTKKENKKLFDLIIELELPFDQLIDEYDYNWVHVSFSERNRRQILHVR